MVIGQGFQIKKNFIFGLIDDESHVQRLSSRYDVMWRHIMASFAHKVYAQYGRCVNAGAFSSFLIPLVLKETEYLGNSLIISGSLEGGSITIQQYFDAADTGK